MHPVVLHYTTSRIFFMRIFFHAGLVLVANVDISMIAPASMVDRLFITLFPLVYFNEFYETLPFLS